MPKLKNYLLLIIVFLLINNNNYANDTQITLFIQPFAGEAYLSNSITTIIELQIWQTLRKAPSPNPENLSFGKGRILRNFASEHIFSHHQAEEIVKDIEILAQGILWGKTWQYGGGVVVQAYLSIPSYNDYRDIKRENWEIEFEVKNKKIIFKAELPKRRYEFAPIVLDTSIVNMYSSPYALKLYSTKQQKKILGYLGTEFTSLWHDKDFVFVESNNKKRWLYLPKLSKSRSELVNFTGGIIRFFRSDWNGTIELMEQVLHIPNISRTLMIDSYLFILISKQKLGLKTEHEQRELSKLNPYSTRIVKFLLMCEINKLKKILNQKYNRYHLTEVINNIEKMIYKNRYLFSKSDKWLQDTLDNINYLKNSYL